MGGLNFKDWSFNESDVNAFTDNGDSIIIELGHVRPEGIDIYGSKRFNIKIEIGKAHSRRIEEQQCDAFSFLFDDGQVVFIEIEGNHFSAVIRWNDFKARPAKDCTLHYRACGESITITEIEK